MCSQSQASPSSAGFGSIAEPQIGKRGKKDMVYRTRQLYR
jgi:hypothetical protein